MRRTIEMTACLFVCILSCWSLNAIGEVNVESNVSYQSVTELGYRDADKKLVYGKAQQVLLSTLGELFPQ